MRRAFSEVKHHPQRLIAVILSITISVGFIAACLIFVSGESRATAAQVSAATAKSDVVVPIETDGVLQSLAAIRAVPGVGWVEPSYRLNLSFTSAGGPGAITLNSLAEKESLRWGQLVEGRWPSRADEVVLDPKLAKQYGLAPGHTLEVPRFGEPASTITLKVVGLARTVRSLTTDAWGAGFVGRDFFAEIGIEAMPAHLLILSDGSLDAQRLAEAVQQVIPAEAKALTAEAYAEQQLLLYSNGIEAFRIVLLIFSAIALLVGAIIIANTFAILVVQRQRQIGLLRAVGASTAQVRRDVLLEAALIGIIGSMAGLALGIGVGAVAGLVTGSLSAGLALPVRSLLLAFLTGVVVTIAAAAVPAARATRVAPLEALRPVLSHAKTKRASRLRLMLAAGFGVVGLAVTVFSLLSSDFNVIIAILGCILITMAVLASAGSFVPYTLRQIGRLSRGTVGRLAAANSVRNPARAAATCTALMLGVGLIVTLQVGSASTKETVSAGIDAQFPVDLMVTSYDGALPPTMINRLIAMPGLKATAQLRRSDAEIVVGGKSTEVGSVALAGLGGDGAGVVAAGYEELNDQVALAHANTAEGYGIDSGDTVTLKRQGRSVSIRVVVSDVAAESNLLLLTPVTLAQLDPEAPIGSVWIAVSDPQDASDTVAALNKIVGGQEGVVVGGPLQQSADLGQILDRLLLIATALLAVAVGIALIGVGNTLGLSVIERTRESALLRALGLQRGQLRVMLLIEAILLALVGALVGIAAGAAFGVVGAAAVAKEIGEDGVVFAMSLPQTLAVVAVAVLAGALASVLPGRRAALASPTEALADL